MMRDEIEKLVREHINEWYADWSRQEVEVPRLAAALHAAWERNDAEWQDYCTWLTRWANTSAVTERERADAAEARLEQEEVYRKMAEEERDQLAGRVKELEAQIGPMSHEMVNTHNLRLDLEARLAALREALEKAARTASNYDNPWCRACGSRWSQHKARCSVGDALAADDRRDG